MSEFKIHQTVNELIKLCNASPSTSVNYFELLMNSSAASGVTSHSQGTLQQLLTKIPNKDAFLDHYRELKSKNVENLDAIVYMIWEILKDSHLKSALGNVADVRVEELSRHTPIGEEKKEENAPENNRQWISDIRERLKSVKTSSGVKELSEVAQKVLGIAEVENVPILKSEWMKSRPYLTMDFITQNKKVAVMGQLPRSTQEQCLMKDLLLVLTGVEGEYIRPKSLQHSHQQREIIIDQHIDASLKEYVKLIVPVCVDYSLVVRFMEEKSEFSYGQVNQALASAFRGFVKDYLVLIAQLETQLIEEKLTLKKLWFYLQPIIKTLRLLASVAATINKTGAFGGQVLSYLHERTIEMQGDSNDQQFLLHLAQLSSAPYMRILEKWIYKGVIADPYGEFLVKDNEMLEREESDDFYCSDYWAKRYTIRKERIPSFLKNSADRILRTGKYLNVMRQCGKGIKCPHDEKLLYTLERRTYVDIIEQAYHFSSKTLLDLLLKDMDLKGRLRSVKHYFLLDQGDLMIQLMELLASELDKPTKEVEIARLDSLLHLALRTTQANCDPYKDCLLATLLPVSLEQQMRRILLIRSDSKEQYFAPQQEDMSLAGWESFSFGYQVRWPVSLILNTNTLTCYQMIFRHLFFSKHVEKLLCNVWISNKVVKIFPLQASRMYAPAFMLRQRMLNFVQNLESYMTFEVIEPSWHIFLNRMQMVSNVDEVLSYHQDFLDTCLKDCMLTSPDLLNIVIQLLKICIEFTEFIQKMKKYFIEAELGQSFHMQESEEREQSPELTTEPCASESFEQKVARFDLKFNAKLLDLLSKISEIGRGNNGDLLLNMVYRLDFNGFYKEQLDQLYSSSRK